MVIGKGTRSGSVVVGMVANIATTFLAISFLTIDLGIQGILVQRNHNYDPDGYRSLSESTRPQPIHHENHPSTNWIFRSNPLRTMIERWKTPIFPFRTGNGKQSHQYHQPINTPDPQMRLQNPLAELNGKQPTSHVNYAVPPPPRQIRCCLRLTNEQEPEVVDMKFINQIQGQYETGPGSTEEETESYNIPFPEYRPRNAPVDFEQVMKEFDEATPIDDLVDPGSLFGIHTTLTTDDSAIKFENPTPSRQEEDTLANFEYTNPALSSLPEPIELSQTASAHKPEITQLESKQVETADEINKRLNDFEKEDALDQVPEPFKSWILKGNQENPSEESKPETEPKSTVSTTTAQYDDIQ